MVNIEIDETHPYIQSIGLQIGTNDVGELVRSAISIYWTLLSQSDDNTIQMLLGNRIAHLGLTRESQELLLSNRKPMEVISPSLDTDAPL